LLQRMMMRTVRSVLAGAKGGEAREAAGVGEWKGLTKLEETGDGVGRRRRARWAAAGLGVVWWV